MTDIERLDQKRHVQWKVLLLYLSTTYNSCILENYFPNELKSGDISSLFKKDDAFNKKNYRPITALSSVSKIFERLVYEQVIP